MEIKNLKDKDFEALDGLFKQFWGESSDINKMAEMFELLSRDKDYVLLAAKQNDVLVGFCMGGCPPLLRIPGVFSGRP